MILFFPNALEPRDRRRRKPLGLGAEQSGQRLAEVAAADSLEIEPGDQLLDALGLAQVGRQDRRGELLTPLGRPAVVDARLLDGNRPQSGGKGPLGQMAVADDLAKAVAVAAVLSAVDPVGDLSLNGLGE